MFLSLNVLLDFLAVSHFHRKDGATWVSDSSQARSADAFGSLMDLARLNFDSSSGDKCGVCNTINFGHANFCKGCSHKLPPFYASYKEEPRFPRRTSLLAERASLTDFAAFVLVVNVLVGIAEMFAIQ